VNWLEAFNIIRKESGMSLDELSEASGVPKGTLSKITAGITKSPSIETMRALVHAMGRTLDDLDPKEKEPTGIEASELSENEKLFMSLPSELRQEALRYMKYLVEQEGKR
jgi:transcriptional regulator with XRE-family HTH domain